MYSIACKRSPTVHTASPRWYLYPPLDCHFIPLSENLHSTVLLRQINSSLFLDVWYVWFSKCIWKYSHDVRYLTFFVDYWIRRRAAGILTVLVWMELLLYSPQAHFQDPFWSSTNKSELFKYQLVSQGSLLTAAATVWLCQLIHQLIFWLVSWQLYLLPRGQAVWRGLLRPKGPVLRDTRGV